MKFESLPAKPSEGDGSGERRETPKIAPISEYQGPLLHRTRAEDEVQTMIDEGKHDPKGPITPTNTRLHQVLASEYSNSTEDVRPSRAEIMSQFYPLASQPGAKFNVEFKFTPDMRQMVTEVVNRAESYLKLYAEQTPGWNEYLIAYEELVGIKDSCVEKLPDRSRGPIVKTRFTQGPLAGGQRLGVSEEIFTLHTVKNLIRDLRSIPLGMSDDALTAMSSDHAANQVQQLWQWSRAAHKQLEQHEMINRRAA